MNSAAPAQANRVLNAAVTNGPLMAATFTEFGIAVGIKAAEYCGWGVGKVAGGFCGAFLWASDHAASQPSGRSLRDFVVTTADSGSTRADNILTTRLTNNQWTNGYRMIGILGAFAVTQVIATPFLGWLTLPSLGTQLAHIPFACGVRNYMV